MNKRRFAISDIHGCSETFKVLLQDKLCLSPKDELYLLGDYIDRGPDSKGVLDHIISLKENGFQVKCLMGNHEAMLLDALYEPMDEINWLLNGGDNTLESFDIGRIKDIPDNYLRFIENMGYFVELEEVILVHAGFNFKIHDPFSDKKAMLWTRDDYSDFSKIAYKTVIHGHTPAHLGEIKQKLNTGIPQTISIDNGCCYKHDFYPKTGEKASKHSLHEEISLGSLCALDIDSFELHVQTNIDEHLY